MINVINNFVLLTICYTIVTIYKYILKQQTIFLLNGIHCYLQTLLLDIINHVDIIDDSAYSTIAIFNNE